MARIGRLDLGFSTKDQDLWDFLESLPEKSDRAYWLKYYARLGLVTSGKISSNLEIPNDQKKRRNTRKNTNSSVPANTDHDKQLSQQPHDKTEDLDKPKEENRGDDVLSIRPAPKIVRKPSSVDPVELRKRLMSGFIEPDEDLLKEINTDKPSIDSSNSDDRDKTK